MCIPQSRNYAKFQTSETPSVDSTVSSQFRLTYGTLLLLQVLRVASFELNERNNTRPSNEISLDCLS